jgi:hypothetical protein
VALASLSSAIFVHRGGRRITLLRRWLGSWLVVVVRPSCHVVRLVATLLTATWYLYLLREQAARGEGGGLLTWSCRKPRRVDLSGSFGWLTWRWDVALRHLILPGSFWSSLTIVTLRHGQRYGGVAVVDGWAIGAGVGDDGG